MPFGTLFSGLNLSPGSDEFRTIMGLTAQPLRDVGRADSELMMINVADFERNTGRNIRDMLAAAMAGGASGGGTAAPPAAAPPAAPAPTAAPSAAAGVVILNPLLDLDLVPVRPGDLITADSFNALIAACASLHIRLGLLETRAGITEPKATPTPTPTPGATPTPTPPAKTTAPDLREAFLQQRTVGGRTTMVILARGTGLSGITAASLQVRTATSIRATSVKLSNWRASGDGLLFDIPKPTATLRQATSVLLRVSSPDGADSVPVEEPTRAKGDALESALLKVEKPLDLVIAPDLWASVLGRFG